MKKSVDGIIQNKLIIWLERVNPFYVLLESMKDLVSISNKEGRIFSSQLYTKS